MTDDAEYLSLAEVLELHREALRRDGGSAGLRDLALLQSSVAQPTASFGGKTFYPTLAEKAAALGHSLVANHPFVDGNKRVGLEAMDVFLLLNGYELQAGDDDAEATILALAAGTLSRDELALWVRDHIVPRPSI